MDQLKFQHMIDQFDHAVSVGEIPQSFSDMGFEVEEIPSDWIDDITTFTEEQKDIFIETLNPISNLNWVQVTIEAVQNG